MNAIKQVEVLDSQKQIKQQGRWRWSLQRWRLQPAAASLAAEFISRVGLLHAAASSNAQTIDSRSLLQSTAELLSLSKLYKQYQPTKLYFILLSYLRLDVSDKYLAPPQQL